MVAVEAIELALVSAMASGSWCRSGLDPNSDPETTFVHGRAALAWQGHYSHPEQHRALSNCDKHCLLSSEAGDP